MITRRQFGSLALRAGTTGALGALAGCSDTSEPVGEHQSVQLSWLKDVSFAGTYIAMEEGYFSDAGLDVDLRAGGPNVVVPPVVAAGTALVGMASTDVTATSRKSGSCLRIIGARFQRNPFCIISKPDLPLKSPADLVGKRIGVSPTNTLAFQSFLAVNGIPSRSVKQIPVQFDVTPLTSGEVNGLLGYFTSQPNILAAQGITAPVMMLSDYGYTLFENVYIVKEAEIERRRESIVAFMRGERRGWQDNLDNPNRGVELTLSKYGKDTGLDRQTQTRENASQIQLIKPASSLPLLGMAPADITANLVFLRDRLKIDVDDALFDTSILETL